MLVLLNLSHVCMHTVECRGFLGARSHSVLSTCINTHTHIESIQVRSEGALRSVPVSKVSYSPTSSKPRRGCILDKHPYGP